MAFKKPDLEEVKQQFELKGQTKELAEKFYAYYEANGWYVGRTKMKNWKAAVAYWVLNQKKNNYDRQTTEDRFNQW